MKKIKSFKILKTIEDKLEFLKEKTTKTDTEVRVMDDFDFAEYIYLKGLIIGYEESMNKSTYIIDAKIEQFKKRIKGI